MKLFEDKNNILTPITKPDFKSEKEIQDLVEYDDNMKTLFGLKLISSEFSVAGFRLDSLAFDEENNAFVIVEYKRGHSYSIIDQGFSYLSTMLDRKADFVLKYNGKTGKQLNISDVNWGSSRVIFVSPFFNTYQKNSVNFRDMPFELWEIKKFSGGMIVLEQHESSSNESIKQVLTPKGGKNSTISKVLSEVKVVTEEDHVKNLDADIRPVWSALKEKFEVFPDTSISPVQQYISWKRDNKIVCYMFFQKKEIRVHIMRGYETESGGLSKNFFNLDDPKGCGKERIELNGDKPRTHVYHITLKKSEEIAYTMFLLEQKYSSLA